VNGNYYDAHVSCSVPIRLGDKWAQSAAGYLEIVGFQRTDGKSDENCFGGKEPDCGFDYTCSNLQTYSTKDTGNSYKPPTIPYKFPTPPPSPPPTKKPVTRAPTTKAPVMSPTKKCVDEYFDPRQCELWKAQGYCAPDSAYSAFMTTKCAKSCNFCGIEVAPVPIHTPKPSPKPTPKPFIDYSLYRGTDACTSDDVCALGKKPDSLTFTYVGFNPFGGYLSLCQRCAQGLIVRKRFCREFCSIEARELEGSRQSKIKVKSPGPQGKNRMNVRLFPNRKNPIDRFLDIDTVNKIKIGENFTLASNEEHTLPATLNIKVGKWKIQGIKINCKKNFPLHVGDQFGSLVLSGYTASSTSKDGTTTKTHCSENWRDTLL
jgi:hypothetical protein